MEWSSQLLSNWWLDALLGVIVTYLAMGLGKVLLEYRNDYQPVASFFRPEASTGFNAVYQILFAPTCTVFIAIVLYLLGLDHLVIGIWTISIWYFIWQTILIVGISRWLLLDRRKFFVFHAISIVLTYYMYTMLIRRGLSHLLPDEANLRTEMWLIVALFLYGILSKIKGNQERYRRRNKAWALAHAKRFGKKYRAVLSNYPVPIQEVLLALMIYEDFNRPRVTRIIERISNASTQTIMQVQGARTDEDGIRSTAESMESHFPTFLAAVPGGVRSYYDALSAMVSVHNSGDYEYSSRISQIFTDIHDALPLAANSDH